LRRGASSGSAFENLFGAALAPESFAKPFPEILKIDEFTEIRFSFLFIP